MFNTLTNVTELTGVGPAMAKRFAALKIRTLGDLVYHLPRTYEDRSVVTPLTDLIADHRCTMRVRIESIATRRAHRRRMTITEAVVSDDSERVKVIWFNKPYLEEQLEVGTQMYLTGAPKDSKYGLTLQNPEHEIVYPGKEQVHSARIVPEYPLTAGLTHKQMRHFIKLALDHVMPLKDPLPAHVLEQHQLLHLNDALRLVHFPENPESFEAAHKRLDFDTLFITQLYVLQQREEIQKQLAQPLEYHEEAVRSFVENLPFTLTGAQKRAAWDALQDMQNTVPMNRLVVGDVGSGKTVVAAMALYNAVLSKTEKGSVQAALMAPTELLAKQHHKSLTELFANTDVRIALLTASEKTTDATEYDIVVGTHALIQDSVTFNNLGLVVVDEQHRFGVQQRKTLREQSGDSSTLPHLLSMTATPIPRTLALALYSDLDLSIIDEMPAGRKPVQTHLVPAKKRADSYDFIRKHIADGEQCFVICPLIDPSDTLEVKSVTEEHERLSKEVFPDLAVELLHGKMKPAEKDDTMLRMRNKEIDILVATSVIEVGVDIPDATVMVIEGAERFGLAQLHQFRGRVGRSSMQSYCLLFTDSRAPHTLERLTALTESTDGFKLAEKDLELRGAGELLGSLQSGFSEAAFLAIQQPELLASAQQAAKGVLANSFMESKEGAVLHQLFTTFSSKIHLE